MTRMMKIAAGFEPIERELARQLDLVTVIFERQLASDMSAVNKLCMHVEQYRGKMLRPTLVLLSGMAAASESRGQKSEVRGQQAATVGPLNSDLRHLISDLLTEKHRVVAAVVEMIHMATLVHDDVLDEATVRRRGRTVNDLWGNEMAVILGDYLISNAFHLCSTIGDPAINLALGDVTNTLCEGELVQLHHRDDYSIDQAMYIEIVRRKTASLIGECCRLGAMLSGAPERIGKAMKNFGTALGIAFQIQDDLLDLIGDQGVVGKSLGKDLDKGKLTLPVIYQLAEAEASERGEALRLIMDRDSDGLRRRLIDSGAVARTKAAAESYVAAAKAELAGVPAGAARDYLATLAESVAARTW